jgi:hypothetical protein
LKRVWSRVALWAECLRLKSRKALGREMPEHLGLQPDNNMFSCWKLNMEESTSKDGPIGSSLFEFPLEIRQQIYRLLYLRNHSVIDVPLYTRDLDYLTKKPHSMSNSLLLSSKQISQEALDILYSENVFKLRFNFDGDFAEQTVWKTVGRGNLQRIKKVLLVIWANRDLIPIKCQLNMGGWSPIIDFSQLTRLVIVASPRKPLGWYDMNEDDWLECFERWMGQFSRRLTNTLVVEIDDNDSFETRAVISASFPIHGAVQTRTLTGDHCYLRTRGDMECPSSL